MHKKVVLWGMGQKAECVYDEIFSECEIVAVIDSDPEKQMKLWKDDLLVCGPEKLEALEYDYVIVTPLNYDAIEQKLGELGVCQEKVICYWKDDESHGIFKNRALRILEEKHYKDVYRARLDSAPYEWGLKRVPMIESAENLLKVLLCEKKSLSRFGDGEFEIMRGNNRAWFQKTNVKLTQRLLEIFRTDDERILIAAAQNFAELDRLKEVAADDIRIYMEGRTREDIISFFNSDRLYYDAYVSRPYIFWKTSDNAQKIFMLFKEIWKDRDVVMVEGKYGRTGVCNDLFAGAKSMKRIACPAKDAWDVYEDILAGVIQNTKKSDLICISLGPTASVLTYDLMVNGYQAIDIGQLDNEYEWYLMGTEKRVPIKGKMAAEVANSFEVNQVVEMEYVKDVVCCIGE